MVEPPRSPWQVHIFGPQAVGKMTVGQALSRRTGAPLFHNHLTIDMLTEVFPFGSDPFGRLVEEFRSRVVEEAAAAGQDLIITGAWPFDDPTVQPIVDSWAQAARSRGGDAFFVELRAPLDVRLERNRTENRRRHKKVGWATDEWLARLSALHRWESTGDFPYPDAHLVIDNTAVAPEAAAELIIERFGLPRIC